MNDIFNFSRFTKVVRSECIAFQRFYIAMVTGFATGAVLSYLLSDFKTFGADGIGIVAMVFITLMPFIFYNNVYHRLKGVNYTMLPASNFEKWLAFWLQCMVIVPLMASILWAMVAGLTSWTGTAFHAGSSVSWLNRQNAWSIYLGMISTQSIAMLGVMAFRRLKWLKTTSVMLGVGVVISLIVSLLGGIYGVHGSHSFNFAFMSNDFNITVEGFKWGTYFEIVTYIIFPFGMWLASFFKLQEQTI